MEDFVTLAASAAGAASKRVSALMRTGQGRVVGHLLIQTCWYQPTLPASLMAAALALPALRLLLQSCTGATAAAG